MKEYISNILHTKPVKKEKEYINVKIQLIVYDLSDSNDEVIKNIKSYTLSKNMIFETRRFNSYKHSNDRHYIRSLPAFHLYVNNIYERTFYPNTRPFQHVNEGLEIYMEKIKNKKKNKEDWNKFYANIRFNLRYICGLTSLMERNKLK
jgi:hypothetical protein